MVVRSSGVVPLVVLLYALTCMFAEARPFITNRACCVLVCHPQCCCSVASNWVDAELDRELLACGMHVVLLKLSIRAEDRK